MLAGIQPVLDSGELLALQRAIGQVHASPGIIDYCHGVLTFTRQSSRFVHGLSPRAGLGLLRRARAWALLGGREFLIPEDIQAVLPACVPHRLITGEDNGPAGHTDIAEYILEGVPVP